MSRAALISTWVLQFVAAAILLQTLFFKFTGAEESVFIFSRLGLEPWGRIGTGVAELIAALLLLVPATAVLGALFTLGIISGAILSHLFVLGVVVQNDGGLLFTLAVVVFTCALAVLAVRRSELSDLIEQVTGFLSQATLRFSRS